MDNLRVYFGGQRPADVAEEMCDAIKAVIYSYEDRAPLALAVGVLEIAKAEILLEAVPEAEE
ncbi:hypothetical protein N6L27_03540 [Leisingera sp. SS27]|uniref:hypothetical protein n=1 Tax=Leisingera sp. SS27 TaxID=2979462 RepID=UPI00232F74C6|nr:hypothetical protein [Leisingera sp. SS27]MDC0657063.1 hypothetical protein [Leisingera sp. SS27]